MQEIESEDCSYAQAHQSCQRTLRGIFGLFDNATHLFGLPISIRVIMVDAQNCSSVPSLLPGSAAEFASQVNKNAKPGIVGCQSHDESLSLKLVRLLQIGRALSLGQGQFDLVFDLGGCDSWRRPCVARQIEQGNPAHHPQHSICKQGCPGRPMPRVSGDEVEVEQPVANCGGCLTSKPKLLIA